jgi:hypothetical protein
MTSTNDLSLATRELFVRSVAKQVYMRTPFIEELYRRNKVTFSGGKHIERLLDIKEMDDLYQAYSPNDVLKDGKREMLAKPRFTFKYGQVPLKYDVDEYTENYTAKSNKDIALLDMAGFLAEKGQRAMKLAMMKMMFNVNPEDGSGSETGVGDNAKQFQSLASALDHGVSTYGTIARTIGGANGYWMGADPEGRPDIVSSSNQTTAYNISIANIRKWLIPIEAYMEEGADLYIMMCPTLFNKLRSEVESHGEFSLDKSKMEYGIESFSIDRHQIVKVPYLQNGYGTSGTTENWVFMLNLNDWELRIHSDRNFDVTPFEWQGKYSNGLDYYLARIMVKGNLLCWKPNGSMWLKNVS